MLLNFSQLIGRKPWIHFVVKRHYVVVQDLMQTAGLYECAYLNTVSIVTIQHKQSTDYVLWNSTLVKLFGKKGGVYSGRISTVQATTAQATCFSPHSK